MSTNSFQYARPGNTSAIDVSRFGLCPGAAMVHCHNGSVTCGEIPESGEIEVPGACSGYNTEHLNTPFYCPDENVKCGCPGSCADSGTGTGEGCADCEGLAEQVNTVLQGQLQ